MLPNQMMLHPSLDARTELIFIAPPFFGVRGDGNTSTTWYDAGLEGVDPYIATLYGEDFLLMNGRGDVRRRRPGDTTLTALPHVPNAATAATFAGRTFLGAAVIDGNYQPLGMRWPTLFDNYDYNGDTSGFELLISNDTIAGDRIMALRPMGFDYMAILCRKSIWIGRRTQDDVRPADFASRITGKGCCSEPTARLTYGGVVYLSDEGVELFDGNVTTHISKQIDDEILPIVSDYPSVYSGAYNPHTQLYYLFTPTYTYVYDCLRQRWHRRDMPGVLAGLPFSEQFHATTWGEMVGTWAEQTTIWKDLSPAEIDIPEMYFLGNDVDSNRVLVKEDMDSRQMFGRDVQFLWGSPFGELQRNNYLVTHKEIRIHGVNGGSVDLWLPDNAGVFEKVTTVAPLGVNATNIQDFTAAPGVHTGKGVGVQVEITEGDPRIGMVELDYLPRKQRLITGGGFTPREYEADF